MKKTLLFASIILFLILWFEFFFKSWVYFFLDTIFFPVYELKPFFSQNLFANFRDIFTFILWYELYSKFFMLLVLLSWVFLWINIWKLISYLLKIKDEKKILFNNFVWIIFTLFNPFIYERLVSQTWIAFWVIFVWLWFIYLIDFILKEKNLGIYLSSLFFGLSLNIFPHALVFIILIWLLFLIFFYQKFKVKPIFISALIFILLNINLVLSLIYWNNEEIINIIPFDNLNLQSFKSNSLDNLWVEITHLLWYWFWWEKYNHILLPNSINPNWYMSWFVILIIILLWFIKLYKTDKKLSIYLLVLLFISYVLSLWISSKLSVWINMFLYDNIPYYIGMREPAKLIGLYIIIYSIYFITWLNFIVIYFEELFLKYKIKKINYVFNLYNYFIVVFLFIIAWSPNVLFGFNWQIKITKYPDDFFIAKNLLEEEKDSKNLFLPWHSYIACDWTNWKIISNPVNNLFASTYWYFPDNIEIWELYSNSQNKYSIEIEEFIKNKDYSKLKKLDINNIVLFKNCADIKTYDFLNKEKMNLNKVFNWESLSIYKIKYE